MFTNPFLFLDPTEKLSHYPITDSSHWLREDAQRIMDKNSRQDLMILIASTLSSGTFLLNFCFLPIFAAVFIVSNFLYGLIDEISMANKLVIPSRHNLAYLLASVER